MSRLNRIMLIIAGVVGGLIVLSLIADATGSGKTGKAETLSGLQSPSTSSVTSFPSFASQPAPSSAPSDLPTSTGGGDPMINVTCQEYTSSSAESRRADAVYYLAMLNAKDQSPAGVRAAVKIMDTVCASYTTETLSDLWNTLQQTNPQWFD